MSTTKSGSTVWVQSAKWLVEYPDELECQPPEDLSVILGYPVDEIAEYDNICRRKGLERDRSREAELTNHLMRSEGEIRVWVDADGNETVECVHVDAPK